jgi:transposase InsO family protein
MPWKETNVMDIKKEFITRALRDESSFISLCREYGISTKTGYKWKERFFKKGLSGLADQSRKPHTSPYQICEEDICRLIHLKLAHCKWGPKKIHNLFERAYPYAETISLSTVKRVLDKSGLVEHRRRRSSNHCGRIENRFAANAPNDIWTVDFKGWWYSADKARIEPLTVRDAYSRYILCVDAIANSQSQTVRHRFELLFRTYGLPEYIRSDNGTPFACTKAPLGLSSLSAWWVALGIGLDRIEPGHPEQNGGHERMHRDIACELEGSIDGDLTAHQAALEIWRQEFNHQRPHEALNMRVPADVYVKSQRKFDTNNFELSYPSEYLRRKVGYTGCIKIMNHEIRISAALRGWDIGLKVTGSKHFAVWFGKLYLGEIDMETESFNVAS